VKTSEAFTRSDGSWPKRLKPWRKDEDFVKFTDEPQSVSSYLAVRLI
jgi:hypothetical protein